MLRNVRKLFSMRALPRIIFKRPASIPTATKTSRLTKTLVTLANAGVVALTNKEPGGIEAFDAELQKASEDGQRALTDLLNTLSDQILSVSAQYQKCLDQQLAIMKEDADHMDGSWQEFRIMSEDLKVELDNLLIVANTMGRMLQLDVMKYLNDSEDFVKLAQQRFKELGDLLNQEAKKVKKLEKTVLDMQEELKK